MTLVLGWFHSLRAFLRGREIEQAVNSENYWASLTPEQREAEERQDERAW